MDDMNAFERQVAGEFVRRAGPVRPVNAAAILTAITATQSPKWRFQSMFSATKFVVAGAIVALFGGFLLAGVLTQPRGDEQAPAVGASASAMAQDAEAEQSELSPSPGTFTPTGSLATPREGHTATLLPDGRVLVLGGFNRSGKVASAEVWDPSAMSFEPAGSIAAGGGVGLTATLLSDGRVLVVGDGAYGWPRADDPESPAEMEVWDPATRSFSPAGPQAGRALHTATLLSDGRVLFAGGNFWDAERDAYDAPNEVWDPETGSFTPASPMAEARYEPTATLLPDGRVLIIGGSEPGDSSGDTLFTAEVWDPATESFSLAGSLERARWGHSATLLSDGRVLVVGGTDYSETVPGPPYVYAAEVWDPATESFSPAGSLEQGRWRSGHTATLLPDGRVLVVGGGAPGADIWEPSSESFSPAAAPLERRLSHTATLLPEGRVLLVGGAGNGSAEIWSPADYEAPSDESARVASTPDLLPGVDLVTEEVEPGVYRVLADGAGHDLVAEPPGNVTVAPDGSIWLLRSWDLEPGTSPQLLDALFELGAEGIHELAITTPSGTTRYVHMQSYSELAVDAGGTVWVLADGLLSFDGTSFAQEGMRTESLTRSVAAGVARLVDGEWVVFGEPALESGILGPDYAGQGGTVWASDGQRLVRHDGDGWETVDLPLTGFDRLGPLAVGSDGTLWVYLRAEEFGAGEYLARHDSDGWSLFDQESGVPLLEWHTYASHLAVDAEGRLWIAPGAGNSDGWPVELPAPLGPADGPVGVLTFDGENWNQYLDGIQVNRLAVADDGTVYATGLFGCTRSEQDFGGDEIETSAGMCADSRFDLSLGGLYAITPEAMAGTE